MVNTCEYSLKIGESLHIGAATYKMVSIVKAMRAVGAKAILISIPCLGKHARHKVVPSFLLRGKGIPQCFLPVSRNPYLRKLYALLGFAMFCALRVRPTDRVILYNHMFEYLLGFLILFFRGNRPVLDIEDAPIIDYRNYYSLVNRLLFVLYLRFSSKKKIIVSQKLARIIGLKEYCVVYGSNDHHFKITTSCDKKFWCDLKSEIPFVVHYGGTLCTDTGVDVFCSAVEHLISFLPHNSRQLHFVVTGFGAEEKICSLVRRSKDSGVKIYYNPNLSPIEYLQRLNKCHASLVLKLSDSEMGRTTFPSKVVEITTRGLLLISTPVSDVPILFDDSNAVLLNDSTPQSLVEAILAVLANPEHMQKIAKRGQRKALELFDPQTVGQSIVDFIMRDSTFLEKGKSL